MRSVNMAELSISLDRAHPVPLPQQLASAVRALIDRGVLQAGDALPSSRAWAARLGVSRGTIVTAFDQLTAEGYLTAQAGAATRVNPAIGQVHPHRAASRESRPLATPERPARVDDASRSHAGTDAVNMLPGQPSTEALRTPAWRRAWRYAADERLGPLPPAGDARYLAGVAEHFRRMRGLARRPEEFLVTAGAREGLALIVQTLTSGLAQRRPLRVGVESPGYPSLRRVLRRLGCELVPLEVDRDGLRTGQLPREGEAPDLVIVTPSHQYPFGGSLPISRRHELLAWARAESVLIVEDDFDSELRYVGQPLPTLTALGRPDEDSVVLLGTFSSTIAPSVGIGMLCAPEPLHERLVATRSDLGTPVSGVLQAAMADYLDSGELARHAARVRRTYRQRRGMVLAALDRIPNARVSPMDGGLHAVVQSAKPQAELMASCAAAGVLVSPGDEYWRIPNEAPSTGDVEDSTGHDARKSRASAVDTAGGSIVIGYGHLNEQQLALGLDRLRAAL